MLGILFELGCAAAPVAVNDAAGLNQQMALADLQCREQALAREREALDAHRQALASSRQTLQKFEEVLVRNAELSLQLQHAEARLAATKSQPIEGGSNAGKDAFREALPDAKTRAQSEEAALHTVQALLDSGRLKVMVRNGHGVLIPPRRLDDVDPYAGGR